MPYDLLVVAALAAHLAFLGYLTLGGFLAWRYPHTLPVHVAVVAWGLGSVVIGYPCPLTAAEQWARERAGRPALPAGGFIQHYLSGVIYPERYLAVVQVLVGLLVVASWVGFVRSRRRRTAVARPQPGGEDPAAPARGRRPSGRRRSRPTPR